ncbi:MAG: hypothetical protein LIP23_05520 [Planctomycetes bacterium]|nr:hypothetical protein [Planctomycetota bacterium]
MARDKDTPAFSEALRLFFPVGAIRTAQLTSTMSTLFFATLARKNTITLPDQTAVSKREDCMLNDSHNTSSTNFGAVAFIGSGLSEDIVATSKKEGGVPDVKPGFVDPARARREKIRKLEARLQREKARDSAASRKERNGQLFVWGAMVEAVYRDGYAQERDQLRQWAKRTLTEKRHLQRAENGFARIEGDAAEIADA